MDFLNKLRQQPENIRKLIIWAIIIIIGVVSFILWAKNVQQQIKNFSKEKEKIVRSFNSSPSREKFIKQIKKQKADISKKIEVLIQKKKETEKSPQNNSKENKKETKINIKKLLNK